MHEEYQPYEVYQHPICSFQVQSLCSSKGRAKQEIRVDLVKTVDGLLSLVKIVFGVLNKHHNLKESYRNLHWRLHFHGDVYTLADAEIHHFHLLRYPLYVGQTGWFEGSNASFRFTVVPSSVETICPSKIAQYPRLEVLRSVTLDEKKPLTSAMKSDWLSDDLVSRAKVFQSRFREYLGGANVWSQHASGEYFRDRPKPPKWSEKEEDVLSLLIRSGHKFQECWLGILQHAFVNRSEVGSSQQWYKIRKRIQDATEEKDSLDSPSEMVIKAKQLCVGILEEHLKAGVPELGEHPLLKRKVSESTQSSETSHFSRKRQKVSFSPSTISSEEDDEHLVSPPLVGYE